MLSGPAVGARPAGAARYPRLFSPVAIGALALPDRFAMAPMTTNFAAPDGAVTSELCDYLAARGAGGFSLVITENIGVHPSGRVMPRMVMAHEDALVRGLARLAAEVHATGAKLIGQLSHCGRQSRSRFTGMPLLAASAIPCPLNRETPRALAEEEIRRMAQAFVSAAARLAEAGYDGIELHAAHGYLLGGFLSAYSNKRTDRYGGPLENRMRFLLEVVDGVKARTRLPLTVRISAEEFVADGNTLAESTRIGRALEAHGVDGLSVSVGVYESFNTQSMVGGEDEGRWLPLAGEMKRAVRIPVLAVGRIKRAAVAERALAESQCDVPLFGRAAIADPELPAKIARGEEDRILWCLGCNVCLGRSARPETICPVNPAVGHDRAFAAALAAPVTAPQRIAILGSGLAALTAAWIARQRGHQVTVYEPDGELGGMQRWRARVPGQEEYDETIAGCARRAAEAGVRFEARLPSAGEYNVAWATRRHQPVAAGTCNSYEVLASRDLAPRGAAVTVVGQDLASAEAALRLAKAGARVALASPGKDVALDAHPGYRALARRELEALGAVVRAGETLAGQTSGAPPTRRDAIDAARADAEPDWVYPYGAQAAEFIDDAYEPGQMTSAIYEAAALAMRA